MRNRTEAGESMNIPAVTCIEDALSIYYCNSEIGNREIHALFGSRSSATVSRLKNMVKDEMANRGVLPYGKYKINTAIAFEVWGIDVDDLEKRRKKLKELGLQ